jgi:hypothetical protein
MFHPLMKHCGVTALFSGHDHHYIRGKTYFDLPFFVSGGGGGKTYEIDEDNLFPKFVGRLESSYEGYHFLILDFADGHCVLKAINERGEIFDEVELEIKND